MHHQAVGLVRGLLSLLRLWVDCKSSKAAVTSSTEAATATAVSSSAAAAAAAPPYAAAANSSVHGQHWVGATGSGNHGRQEQPSRRPRRCPPHLWPVHRQPQGGWSCGCRWPPFPCRSLVENLLILQLQEMSISFIYIVLQTIAKPWES